MNAKKVFAATLAACASAGIIVVAAHLLAPASWLWLDWSSIKRVAIISFIVLVMLDLLD